jgi:hypothetical protein
LNLEFHIWNKLIFEPFVWINYKGPQLFNKVLNIFHSIKINWNSFFNVSVEGKCSIRRVHANIFFTNSVAFFCKESIQFILQSQIVFGPPRWRWKFQVFCFVLLQRFANKDSIFPDYFCSFSHPFLDLTYKLWNELRKHTASLRERRIIQKMFLYCQSYTHGLIKVCLPRLPLRWRHSWWNTWVIFCLPYHPKKIDI